MVELSQIRLAVEECPPAKDNQTQRTSCTSTSDTSITSTLLEDVSDPWNFDLDAIIDKPRTSSSPPVRKSCLKRCHSADPTTTNMKLPEEDSSSTFLPSNLSCGGSPSSSSTTLLRVPRSLRMGGLNRDGSSRSLSSSCSSASTTEQVTTARRRTPVRRSVSFDKVRVREFQQILSDNPCQDDGPSIGLGWKYNEKKETKLDKFESKRTTPSLFGSKRTRRSRRNSDGNGGGARSLSADKREKIAKKLGYSQDEIEQNVKQVQKVQKQRKKTLEDANKVALGGGRRGYVVGGNDNQVYDAIAIMKHAQMAHGFATDA